VKCVMIFSTWVNAWKSQLSEFPLDMTLFSFDELIIVLKSRKKNCI
jgi:hypothetical protein